MALTKEEKQAIIAEFQTKQGDTGSTEVQIAVLTKEIEQLNAHLKFHIHDFASKRGLHTKIGQRRSLLKYLEKKDVTRFIEVKRKLNLR